MFHRKVYDSVRIRVFLHTAYVETLKAVRLVLGEERQQDTHPVRQLSNTPEGNVFQMAGVSYDVFCRETKSARGTSIFIEGWLQQRGSIPVIGNVGKRTCSRKNIALWNSWWFEEPEQRTKCMQLKCIVINPQKVGTGVYSFQSRLPIGGPHFERTSTRVQPPQSSEKVCRMNLFSQVQSPAFPTLSRRGIHFCLSWYLLVDPDSTTECRCRDKTKNWSRSVHLGETGHSTTLTKDRTEPLLVSQNRTIAALGCDQSSQLG